MTIWHEVGLSSVGDWTYEQMRRDVPPTFTFMPVAQALDTMSGLLTKLGLRGSVSSRTGAVRFEDTGLQTDQLFPQALLYASSLDPSREWTQWSELSEEESLPTFVAHEQVSSIEQLVSLGAGGRITQLSFPDRTIVDVSVRPRRDRLSTRWADVGIVINAVAGMAAGMPDDARLRAAFGYSEASIYEYPDFLRPVLVFLLDRPQPVDGPAWRVGLTLPATTSEDELPPWAEAGADIGGCV